MIVGDHFIHCNKSHNLYRKRKLMIIFTIAYEIHMRVLLITLDIKLSITGTT